MFKQLLQDRKTSKADVVMAFIAAGVGVWKAFDTVKQYKNDHNEENEK